MKLIEYSLSELSNMIGKPVFLACFETDSFHLKIQDEHGTYPVHLGWKIISKVKKDKYDNTYNIWFTDGGFAPMGNDNFKDIVWFYNQEVQMGHKPRI